MAHKLTLFTHQMCYSRLEGQVLLKEALQSIEGVSVEEKDLIADSQEARTVGAQISPTFVLDGKVLCVGLPSRDEIQRMIREQVEKS